jgi:hypothetical protein
MGFHRLSEGVMIPPISAEMDDCKTSLRPFGRSRQGDEQALNGLVQRCGMRQPPAWQSRALLRLAEAVRNAS